MALIRNGNVDKVQRLAKIHRILARLSRIENNRMNAFQKKNPFSVLMGAYSCVFIQPWEAEIRFKLSEEAHDLQNNIMYIDREIENTKALSSYNKLVCKAAKILKVSRGNLRDKSMSELELLCKGK